jgi:hypothetical protein
VGEDSRARGLLYRRDRARADRIVVQPHAPASALALLLAAGAAAQVYVPDANPGTGPVNSVPLGGKGPTGAFQNMRTQIRVPASFLPAAGSTITDVGFAGADDANYTYALLELRCAHLPGAALAPTFAANLAGETQVLRKQNATLPLARDQWRNVGLTASFVHDGARDLVLDVVIQGAYFTGTAPGTHRSSTLETVYALNYDVAQPAPGGFGPFLAGSKLALTLAGGAVVTVGTGCPKPDRTPVGIAWAGAPARNATFTVRASAAPAAARLVLLLGQSERTFGSVPLPLDLAVLGAPGCILRTDVLASPAVTADGSGAAALSLPIPDNPTLRGQQLNCQWLAPVPGANALGVVVSAMLRATLQ